MRQGAWGWCTGMTQRDGMGVQDGKHMYTHGRFKSMYGKTNPILKKIKNKNKMDNQQGPTV